MSAFVVWQNLGSRFASYFCGLCNFWDDAMCLVMHFAGPLKKGRTDVILIWPRTGYESRSSIVRSVAFVEWEVETTIAQLSVQT